jgi:transcription termination factor Rho
MTLDLLRLGIAKRHDDGRVTIHRPGRCGGLGAEIEVPEELADRFRLASGDVVEGPTEPIRAFDCNTALSDECLEDEIAADEQRDEPAVLRGEKPPSWIVTYRAPTETLVDVRRVNGLESDEMESRPFPHRRHPSERTPPEKLIALAAGPGDVTGRTLDFAAPLAAGYAGIVMGAHGSGLSRTLRSVVEGARESRAFDALILLLLRARSEEVTDWRRRFPDVDIVVCPSGLDAAPPDLTLNVAELALACAQRQTELGRHVLLAVDSLTALWGTMLEEEGADAQQHADRSRARQRIREWVQAAGNFGGEAPLGGSLGGSLTLVGTAWAQEIDAEAEEEGEIHPHLRMLEHILFETSWRVPLSGELASARLFPAIDACRCLSRDENRLLAEPLFEQLLAARRDLSLFDPVERYSRLMSALEATENQNEMLDLLVRGMGASPAD